MNRSEKASMEAQSHNSTGAEDDALRKRGSCRQFKEALEVCLEKRNLKRGRWLHPRRVVA